MVQESDETALPGDPDGDGFYEDLNGNGRVEFLDLLIFFEQMDWISENEPVEVFDYNNNGRIDFSDCLSLFNKIWGLGPQKYNTFS